MSTFIFAPSMIVRISRAQIRPGHDAGFQRNFCEVSLPLALAQSDVVSAFIGRPDPASPDAGALQSFVGDDYTAPVIPPFIDQFIVTRWVPHVEVIGWQFSQPSVHP